MNVRDPVATVIIDGTEEKAAEAVLFNDYFKHKYQQMKNKKCREKLGEQSRTKKRKKKSKI